MTTHPTDQHPPEEVVSRLARLTSAHDLDGIVDCFATDYRNVNPLHPSRDFVGNDQVRRNWQQILHLVPDVRTEIVGLVVDGSSVWTEMEHRGTRPDGSPHLMRGITVFDVADGRITSARFYLEPVEDGGPGADQAVSATVGTVAMESGARP